MNSLDGKDGVSGGALMQLMLLMVLISSSATIAPAYNSPDPSAGEPADPAGQVGLIIGSNGEAALYELNPREP